VTDIELFRLTYEQERRLHRALGITKVQPTGEELVVAGEARARDFEQQTRDLEQHAAERRSFEAKESESRALREQVARLETQLRLAAKERDLDRRDAAEEDEYRRDFAFRAGQRPVI
jgi:hypothetical protein